MYLLVFYPIYWFPINLYICWCSIYLSAGVLSTYLVVSQLSIYLSALVSFPPIYWCPIYPFTGAVGTYFIVTYLFISWCPISLPVLFTNLLVSYLKGVKKTYYTFFSHRLNYYPITMKFIS